MFLFTLHCVECRKCINAQHCQHCTMARWLCNRSLFFIAIIEPVLFVNWMGRCCWIYVMNRMRTLFIFKCIVSTLKRSAFECVCALRNPTIRRCVDDFERGVRCIRNAERKWDRFRLQSIISRHGKKSNRFWCVSHHFLFFLFCFLTIAPLSFQLKNTLS